VGFDENGNGTLEESERNYSFVRCNSASVFTSETRLIVEDCGEGFTFRLGASDSDGTVVDFMYEFIGSGAVADLIENDNGTVTLPAGEHVGGAWLRVVGEDNYGAPSEALVTLSFSGDSCVAADGFFGVNPETCVEIEVVSLAGDDRSAVTLSPIYAIHNGDDSPVRVSRDLTEVVLVVDGPVDTLFSDDVTGQLYSWWSSEFEFTGLAGSDGEFEDLSAVFDQIVPLDEETLEAGTPITMARTLLLNSGVTLNLGAGEFEYIARDIATGMSGDRIVVASRGYDGTSDRDVLFYTVYDATSGEVLSTLSISPDDDNFSGYRWNTQEVDMQDHPIFVRDDEEYFVYQSSSDWWEVNVRTGVIALVSDSCAERCDSATVSVDLSTFSAYGHAESGCFGERYSEEAVFVFQMLFAPNDGSFGDSDRSGD
jgi:hypothetical protein